MTVLVFQYCFAASIQTPFLICKQVYTLEFNRKNGYKVVWQGLLICGGV